MTSPRYLHRALILSACLMTLSSPVAASEQDAAATGVPYFTSQPIQDFQRTQPLARAGDAEAQYNLGLMYDLGHGVKASTSRAARWFTRAALQGDTLAAYNLAVLYKETRQSGMLDLTEAYKWAIVAEASGHEPSKALAGQIQPLLGEEAIADAQKRADHTLKLIGAQS